jgi:hypothetical protein
MSLEMLLAESARSKSPRTRSAGLRVAKEVAKLRSYVHTEVTTRRNAGRIAELESELALLRGQKPAPQDTPKGSVLVCGTSQCKREFDTLHGLNLHRRKMHQLDGLTEGQAEGHRV